MPDYHRVALVTGANQGVGLQVARQLVAHGLTVLVGSRSFDRGQAAAKEIGPGAIPLQLDVTDAASIAAAAERIRTEVGRLDLLVNNAGISNTTRGNQSLQEHVRTSRPSNASLDEMRAVWETNVFGALAVYQAMLPLLRRIVGCPHRQRVERSRLADRERGSDLPIPRHVRPHLSGVQGCAERDNPRHHGRARVDRHQGQPGLAGLHQDQPQRLSRAPNLSRMAPAR